MRGQSSFEYLIIISLLIAFLIPVWAYVLSTQQGTSDELSLTYASNAVRKLVDTSNLVYSQGPPAKVTVRIYMPGGIDELIVIDKTIDIKLRTNSGITDIFESSTATLNFSENLNESLSQEGLYILKIEATDNVVQISQA